MLTGPNAKHSITVLVAISSTGVYLTPFVLYRRHTKPPSGSPLTSREGANYSKMVRFRVIWLSTAMQRTSLFCELWQHAEPSYAVNGFEATGITYPPNRLAITDAQIVASNPLSVLTPIHNTSNTPSPSPLLPSTCSPLLNAFQQQLALVTPPLQTPNGSARVMTGLSRSSEKCSLCQSKYSFYNTYVSYSFSTFH